MIEFKLDGTIVTANENFLNAMGYALDEIRASTYSMFVDPAMRDSHDYRAFWASLNRGEHQAAQYKRIAKGGREIWIQASYNPITDKNGKPVGVIKFATDITAQKIHSMEDAGKIAAINRAQAVIEFNMDGTIVTANENFLGAMGYALAEIQGKHHSMFMPPADRDSAGLSRVLGAAEPRRVRVRRIQAASPRAAARSGSSPATTRSSTNAASRSRSSSSRPTSPSRSSKAADNDGQIDCDRQVAGGDRVQHGRHDPQCEPELPCRDGLYAGRDPGPASQHVRRAGRGELVRRTASSGAR